MTSNGAAAAPTWLCSLTIWTESLGTFKSLPGPVRQFHRRSNRIITRSSSATIVDVDKSATAKMIPDRLFTSFLPRQYSQDSIVPGVNDVQVLIMPTHAVRMFQRNLWIAESSTQHS